MTIQEYITKSLTALADSTNQEAADGKWITVDFDIGVNPDKDSVIVQENSDNRIKFSIDIRRGGK